MEKSIKSFILLLFLISIFNACKKENQTIPPSAIPPVVTNVQPKNPMPGDVVTITGTGFGATTTDVKVTIGTQVITISSVTNTEIKFTLPAGITAGDIAVAIKNIIATNTDPQKATITPIIPIPTAATIISINPTSGKAGDVVSILGTGFSTIAADNVVKFNGTASTVTGSVTSVLTVTVPAGVTTGVVTVSVKGAAVITGPTFTVNATTGGTGSTSIPYIKVTAGTATLSKIATAPSEIGAMAIDQKNNVLYYTDHAGLLYKLKLDGSAPTVLTTDTRIIGVSNIGVDAAGNVVVLAANGALDADVYKIDAANNAITKIATKVNLGGGNYPLAIDTQGGIWNGYGQKLNTTTNTFDRNSTFPYGSFTNTVYQGDIVYVDDARASSNTDVGFYKYDLVTKTGVATDFTLKTLFKQDNPALGGSTQNLDTQSRYALDNTENFYAIYPQQGDATTFYTDYYTIRKTKNGAAGVNSLIIKFYTPYNAPTYTPPRLNSGILFKADAIGNLYMKANGTDIIKIVQ
ncbi:MAG: IPT/TIG domain-containing protein [Mucilaginibacter sp.]|uniref:IPT/TIG domain-containing protein n=1 Tax=Mucilaginibacter sp. TaxID=1882438 RepID=UPI003265F403